MKEQGVAPRRPRVIVIEDVNIVRQMMTAQLRPTYDVVGDYSDGAVGYANAVAHCVDLVIVDLMLPGMSGAEIVRRLLRSDCAPRVLVITGFDVADAIADALEIGAHGIVLKDSSLASFLDAVESVLRGERFLCPSAKMLLRGATRRV
jgi:DNA-binding NarL/FixJ family response regulator